MEQGSRGMVSPLKGLASKASRGRIMNIEHRITNDEVSPDFVRRSRRALIVITTAPPGAGTAAINNTLRAVQVSSRRMSAASREREEMIEE